MLELLKEKVYFNENPSSNSNESPYFEKLIERFSCNDCLNYIKNFSDLNPETSTIVSTNSEINIQQESIKTELINLQKINDIRYINKFFETVNRNLPVGGKFICCVQTLSARKKRKNLSRIPIIGTVYHCFEFVFFRVFPKIKYLKKVYFAITKGRNRHLSKAEALGRLVSCGFEINDFREINGLLYIVSVKKDHPTYDMNPSYGLIYKMPRVGKNGDIIYVYKLRTMHPYSEYLQDFMFKKYGTSNGDKVNDDFRVSEIGSLLRKFWIDEIPMLLNVLKGDLKLIGVRPLSLSKFNMYPIYAREKRVAHKPGLIPPFYADLPQNFNQLINSEMIYIDKYNEAPWSTDCDYFVKAFNNIFLKGVRSL